jgi:hypothetical protein
MPDELAKKEEINLQFVQKTPEILQDIQITFQKAKLYYDTTILPMIVTPETIKTLTLTQDLMKKRKSESMDKRKPVTQLFDAIRTEFTNIESGYTLMVTEIQKKKDDYVNEQEKIRIETEKQEALKLEKEKEKAQVKADAMLDISTRFNNFIYLLKLAIQKKFLESLTLENYDLKTKEFEDYQIPYDFNIDKISAKQYRLCNSSEVDEIISKIDINSEIAAKKDDFIQSMSVFAIELKDKMLQKHNHLVEKSKADEAEKLRLEQLEKQREADQQEKLKKEKEVQEQKEKENIAIQKIVEENKAIVNTQATLFNAAPVASKPYYEITVKAPAGYMALIQFWYDKEGKSLSNDKIEKMNFGKIREFAEKWADKHDEKINSELIHYEQKFKSK